MKVKIDDIVVCKKNVYYIDEPNNCNVNVFPKYTLFEKIKTRLDRPMLRKNKRYRISFIDEYKIVTVKNYGIMKKIIYLDVDDYKFNGYPLNYENFDEIFYTENEYKSKIRQLKLKKISK